VCGTELDDEGVNDFGVLLLQEGFTCPIKLFSCDYFEVREQTTAISFVNKSTSSAVLTLLCGILKLNETIQDLCLAGVGLDVQGCRALETALRTNKTLTSLDLRDNPKLWSLKEDGSESADGLEAVAAGLQTNNTISSVHVDAFPLPILQLKGAEPVAKISYIAAKGLSDVSMTLAGALLERNAATTRLEVSQNATSRVGHAAGRCLRSNTAILEVFLRESALGDDGVGALVEGLLQNEASRLRVLDLASNKIGVAGAEKLAGLLAASKSISKVNLNSNKLGSEGVKKLMPSLTTNSTVSAISLQENEIDVDGAGAIASALKTNRDISTLWLGKNKMGNEGIDAIVDALLEAKLRSGLAVLDVHKNGITKNGIAAITRLLGELPSITAIALVGSKLQFTEAEAMQQAAKENPEMGRSKPVRLWIGTDMNKFPEF
jgi:hypothetical protein